MGVIFWNPECDGQNSLHQPGRDDSTSAACYAKILRAQECMDTVVATKICLIAIEISCAVKFLLKPKTL